MRHLSLFLVICTFLLHKAALASSEQTPSIFTETNCWGTTLPIHKPLKMPPPIPWDPGGGGPGGDPGPIPSCGITGTNACGKPRDWFQNPFSSQSAHHRPIGTGAVYAGDGELTTRDWLRAAPFGINVGAPWGVSVASTGPSDPMMTVRPLDRECSKPKDLPVTIRLPAGGFVTRIVLSKEGCTDGVTVIYDCTTGIPHQIRQYDWNNGNPMGGQYFTWSIRGLGHGVRPGNRIATSASGVAALFGILRGYEINTPGHRIGHALQMVAPRLDPERCNVLLSREAVLPAVSRDGSADEGNNNRGNIPYGGLMAIPRDVNLDALGLSEPGRRLAEALRDYGVYLVDGGGCNGGALRADQYISSSTLNALKNDIPKFYRLMRMVKNNDVLGSPVAGGGTPLAPNCAADAP